MTEKELLIEIKKAKEIIKKINLKIYNSKIKK